MAGKFEVFRDSSGGYRFNLLAGNGQIIASSESYTTRDSAVSGIESVKRLHPTLPSSTATDGPAVPVPR